MAAPDPNQQKRDPNDAVSQLLNSITVKPGKEFTVGGVKVQLDITMGGGEVAIEEWAKTFRPEGRGQAIKTPRGKTPKPESTMVIQLNNLPDDFVSYTSAETYTKDINAEKSKSEPRSLAESINFIIGRRLEKLLGPRIDQGAADKLKGIFRISLTKVKDVTLDDPATARTFLKQLDDSIENTLNVILQPDKDDAAQALRHKEFAEFDLILEDGFKPPLTSGKLPSLPDGGTPAKKKDDEGPDSASGGGGGAEPPDSPGPQDGGPEGGPKSGAGIVEEQQQGEDQKKKEEQKEEEDKKKEKDEFPKTPREITDLVKTKDKHDLTEKYGFKIAEDVWHAAGTRIRIAVRSNEKGDNIEGRIIIQHFPNEGADNRAEPGDLSNPSIEMVFDIGANSLDLKGRWARVNQLRTHLNMARSASPTEDKPVYFRGVTGQAVVQCMVSLDMEPEFSRRGYDEMGQTLTSIQNEANEKFKLEIGETGVERIAVVRRQLLVVEKFNEIWNMDDTLSAGEAESVKRGESQAAQLHYLEIRDLAYVAMYKRFLEGKAEKWKKWSELSAAERDAAIEEMWNNDEWRKEWDLNKDNEKETQETIEKKERWYPYLKEAYDELYQDMHINAVGPDGKPIVPSPFPDLASLNLSDKADKWKYEKALARVVSAGDVLAEWNGSQITDVSENRTWEQQLNKFRYEKTVELAHRTFFGQYEYRLRIFERPANCAPDQEFTLQKKKWNEVMYFHDDDGHHLYIYGDCQVKREYYPEDASRHHAYNKDSDDINHHDPSDYDDHNRTMLFIWLGDPTEDPSKPRNDLAGFAKILCRDHHNVEKHDDMMPNSEIVAHMWEHQDRQRREDDGHAVTKTAVGIFRANITRCNWPRAKIIHVRQCWIHDNPLIAWECDRATFSNCTVSNTRMMFKGGDGGSAEGVKILRGNWGKDVELYGGIKSGSLSASRFACNMLEMDEFSPTFQYKSIWETYFAMRGSRIMKAIVKDARYKELIWEPTNIPFFGQYYYEWKRAGMMTMPELMRCLAQANGKQVFADRLDVESMTGGARTGTVRHAVWRLGLAGVNNNSRLELFGYRDTPEELRRKSKIRYTATVMARSIPFVRNWMTGSVFNQYMEGDNQVGFAILQDSRGQTQPNGHIEPDTNMTAGKFYSQIFKHVGGVSKIAPDDRWSTLRRKPGETDDQYYARAKAEERLPIPDEPMHTVRNRPEREELGAWPGHDKDLSKLKVPKRPEKKEDSATAT
ncbi:MAG: hypothetical protein J5J00_10095 [Deltaproteobacteria bacterium]|nr:hypothetical protein [Deltaproteobacteria bacterium]